MDHKEAHHLRLYVLAALFFIVAAVYIGVLYDTQVNNYDYYYASSVRSIARSETVEAARGNITDRNGKVLVSSRSSYNLTFDASLLEKDEDANESLLRLLQLCQSRGINWVDSLPISRSAPFAYTIDSLDSAARSRFLTYLKDLDEAANALAAYLLEHPALLETTDEEGNRENPADDILADEELDQASKAQALLEELTSSQLTGAMLEGSGLSATRLIALMRKDFGLSASFSVEEARLVLGVQYEIRSRNLARTDPYVLAEDIDAELISLLNDGDYAGAKITPSSVREYETTYGAHILGYLGKINDSAEKEALGEGYNWNDYVGKDGVPRLNILDVQKQIRSLPKPVVALVNGYAIGGGHVLHVVCDLTIASENAIFGQTGPHVGSFDAGFGSSYLARIIGQKKAREMWFLCRQYSAQEALQMGLVNKVVPLDKLEDEGVAWAERMMEMSPMALRMIKVGLNAELDGQAGIQELAGDATLLYYLTDEAQEGGKAFLEKRKPNFKDYPKFP